MQRVITVTTHTNVIAKNADFAEHEYPLLSAWLSEGYKVVQVVPFATGASESYRYSLTFVIEKPEKDEAGKN